MTKITTVHEGIAEIARVFSGDAYELLMVRGRLEGYERAAENGDKAASQLVKIFVQAATMIRLFAEESYEGSGQRRE